MDNVSNSSFCVAYLSVLNPAEAGPKCRRAVTAHTIMFISLADAFSEHFFAIQQCIICLLPSTTECQVGLQLYSSNPQLTQSKLN
jgi:hypothetical protein